MKVDILGVKIDNIGKPEALARIEKWIWNKPAYRTGKHYIVTPNLEFILAAQSDPEFRQIINNSDLAIPDSSSLGFSYWLLKKPILLRLFLWPLIFLPIKQLIQFARVPGIELMDDLCKLSSEKGFVVGFLGGGEGVAEKCAECLKEKYPKLKIGFTESGGEIDNNGNVIARTRSNFEEICAGTRQSITEDRHASLAMTEKVDILFVAFGHIRQEKWIAKNQPNMPIKLAIGVGGAFDYLSGSVPRAPKLMRDLGFEWLFRLFIQPQRLKRQLSLIKYLWLLLKT